VAGDYQVVLLESLATPFTVAVASAIRSALETALVELGLDRDNIAFLREADVAAGFDDKLPTVAIYASDTQSPVATPALTAMLGRALFVLPIVASLRGFSSVVPSELWPINGLEPPTPGDPASVAATAAQRLLEELRLLRTQRGAFISYKRSESSAVAEQLHEALDRRRYEVFLDTFSVDYGVDFQSVLWDRMAGADVIVLLATATAFDSKWVEQEVTRANVAGLAMLQLIWPDLADPPLGTEFAERIYLQAQDFEPGAAASGMDGSAAVAGSAPTFTRLKHEVVTRVAARTETLRAKAQATRRRRVLEELKDAARRNGVTFSLQQDGIAQITTALQGSAPMQELLLPVVGLPDAQVLHEHWLHYQKRQCTGVLLYDALGMLATRSVHLGWLNAHLPQKAVAMQDLDSWLKQKIA
jgi:hypothetical protein